MEYKKIELKYKYDALEPYIDELTMKTHYEKHHTTYETKLNAAIAGKGFEEYKTSCDLLSNIDKVTDKDLKMKIMNFGGGLSNHNLFFSSLKKGTTLSDGKLKQEIESKWGDIERFKAEFSGKATTLFGSGWTWLVLNNKNELEIFNTKNQDSPLAFGMRPIFGIDVWEHAYYLKNKSDRPSYIKDFWNVLDWEFCNTIYNKYNK